MTSAPRAEGQPQMLRVYCWNCRGDIFIGHECGEDTCVCLNPEENIPCETCDGIGYWFIEDTPENRAKLDSATEEIEYHAVAEESE